MLDVALEPVVRQTRPRTDLPLFSFGSTRDREVLEIVLGREVDDEDLAVGVLHGYQARRVKGEHFPVLVPDEDSAVVGLILKRLCEADAARLEYYEADMFGLEVDRVALIEGEPIACQVYSLSSPDLRVSSMAWSFGQFRHAIRPAYLEQIRAFMERT